jgi:uncharacterized protein
MMEGEIAHYEIPARNLAKLSKFYTNVVGWKFKDSGMPGMTYLLISTNSSSKLPSAGMYKKSGLRTPTTYVAVKDIDASTKKLQKNGGKVVVPKQAVPGMGWSLVARDPEGNWIGLFQNDMNAGKSKKGPNKK